jgi:hypothetical protein
MKIAWQFFAAFALLAPPASQFAATNSSPPLPTIEAVLQRVVERSAKEDENDRAFREGYFFRHANVTEFRNSKGEVKKHEERKGENKPASNPVAVKPRSPAENSSSNASAQSSGKVSDSHSNVRGKAFEKHDFLLTGDLLKRFDFTLIGREQLNGRPVLVVEFQPATKKFPARNLKERFINKAAGRVWVDEADYALVKADLHLSERVNVVGGLVGAVWKFTYDFLRDRTLDGLWFTKSSNWHLEGRELFVKRTVDFHEERTDVRPVTMPEAHASR